MLKYIFYCCFIFCACNTDSASGNGSKNDHYHIDVTIRNAPDGPIFLFGHYETQTYREDSAYLANEHVIFTGDAKLPSGMYYIFISGQKYFQILLDDDQIMKLSTDYNNLLTALKVEGCIDTELLFDNLRYEQNIQPKFDAIAKNLKQSTAEEQESLKKEQQLLIHERKTHLEDIFNKNPNSFFTVFKKAVQNPTVIDVFNSDGTLNTARQAMLYRRDFWKDVDFTNPGLLRTPVIGNKIERHFKELTVQHPDSILMEADYLMNLVESNSDYYRFFANWISLEYEPTKTSLMDPEAVFTHMVQNYFTYEKAFWSDSAEIYALQLRASEMAGSLVGNKALDISTTDIKGEEKSIMEMDADYIIVYLFNPTCDHCKIETPKLAEFFYQWQSKGVDVYSIGVDTNEEEWRQYCTNNKLPFVCVFDPTYQSIYGKYYVDITPEIYVLNPDRTIIAKNLKVDQLEFVINKDRNRD